MDFNDPKNRANTILKPPHPVYHLHRKKPKKPTTRVQSGGTVTLFEVGPPKRQFQLVGRVIFWVFMLLNQTASANLARAAPARPRIQILINYFQLHSVAVLAEPHIIPLANVMQRKKNVFFAFFFFWTAITSRNHGFQRPKKRRGQNFENAPPRLQSA